MPTSNEDLQKKAERLQKLREQVAAEESKRTSRESELANDVKMTEMEAEEARLEARLAAAKDAGKVGSVKAGASAPLEAAKEQMERAVAQKKAVEERPSAAERATESTESGGASGDTAASGATTEKEK